MINVTRGYTWQPIKIREVTRVKQEQADHYVRMALNAMIQGHELGNMVVVASDLILQYVANHAEKVAQLFGQKLEVIEVSDLGHLIKLDSGADLRLYYKDKAFEAPYGNYFHGMSIGCFISFGEVPEDVIKGVLPTFAATNGKMVVAYDS
ncbi:hypothetical protein GR28A_00067 [Vibrio phage vB_VcorM_GR28A]|nr:hypothetical protein GR28A_00067 [Vibrio phage vB_VcorM_GR28A]